MKALVAVIAGLALIEAAIIWAVNSLGVTGLAEFVFKGALPVTVLIGFLVFTIGRRS